MASAAGTLDRRDVVARLLAKRDDILVVTGLGSSSYDVHAAGDHDGNFYLWGAMGGAAMVGLGLAQARPERKVVVITGDGEQLMGLGGLATIAIAKPANLVLVVIDNGHFGETGMQMSHTGHGLDLAAVASACGLREARTIRDLNGVGEVEQALHAPPDGPRLFVVKVKAENLPRSMPFRDGVYIKNRFRAQLGFGPV